MKIFQSDFFQDDSLVYPSIQTSTTLTQPPSEGLTSSQAASRVNRSVLPGSKEARRMTVGSGRKCSELLSKHNPLGCLLKTLLASSTWHSTRCYLTWKPKTTPRGRLLFQLAVKMPSTAENDAGSLQSGMLGTPRATEAVRSDKFREGRNPTPEEYVQQHPVSPGQMWPTPRAGDSRGAGPRTNDQSIQKRLDNGTKNLSETVQAVQRGMWPTPNTMDSLPARENIREINNSRDGRKNRQVLSNLREAVVDPLYNRMWPTPMARDYKDSPNQTFRGGEGQWQTAGNGLPTNTNPGITEPRLGGSLNGIPKGLDFPRRWGDGSWEDGMPRVTTQKKGRTQRLKGLGNAIVPQVAYEIIRHFD